MATGQSGSRNESHDDGMLDNDACVEKSSDDDDVRPNWSRSIDFLIACLGGSIGLGNVWRFPYLCYRNGGGAFLIPYFLSMLFGSLPLFILESCIGQYMGMGTYKAWSIVPLFQGIGVAVTVIIFLFNCYYNTILAWGLLYLFNSFSAPLPWDSCEGSWNTDQCSTNFHQNSSTTTTTIRSNNSSNNISSISNNKESIIDSNSNKSAILQPVDPVTEFWENKVLGLSSGIHEMGTMKWDSTLCLLLAWVMVYLCICKGIKSSGKVMYFTAPAPFVFMLIILIRNATLEGASDGVKYYLTPNVTKLSEFSVWTDAVSQTFYSSCISQGIVITLGSYNKFKHNVCRDSIIFSFVNAFTSFFAGFLVFSILGFMAFEQGRPVDQVAESGPGLVFIAYPKAVSQMPLAQLWSVAFFIMIILLGLDSQFLGVEAVITSLQDQFPTALRRGHRKEIFAGVVCIVSFLIGLVFVCEGGMYVFQLFDFYCGGRNLMLIGLLQVVVITYIYGFRRFFENIEMMIGVKWMKWMFPYLVVCWTAVTPSLCFISFILSTINHQELTYSRPNQSVYNYPVWADGIGWTMTAISVIWIPGLAIYRFFKYGFSLQVFRMMLVPYTLKPHQMRLEDKVERRLVELDSETETYV